MSINKFNPDNFTRQYKSLSINTKTLTTGKFENFSDFSPTLSSFNFSGDFGNNGISTETKGTFYNDFVKVSISFSGVEVTSNTGSGIIEFKITDGSFLKNISPTANTNYVFGQGSFVINLEQWNYNLSSTETFFDTEWKMRCTFTPNSTVTPTSSPNNFGNITLFYNI